MIPNNPPEMQVVIDRILTPYGLGRRTCQESVYKFSTRSVNTASAAMTDLGI